MPLFYFRFHFSIIILSFYNINNNKKSFCIELALIRLSEVVFDNLVSAFLQFLEKCVVNVNRKET